MGLESLVRARKLAENVDKDKWQFAVEIRRLREIGMSDCELRWLICKNLIQHGDETTTHSDSTRSFRRIGDLNISERCCFVITDLGVEFMREFGRDSNAENSLLQVHRVASHQNLALRMRPIIPNRAALPHWDSMRHELNWQGRLVKRFKHRSPNQEAVLAAFQEEGWPFKVDDPLTQVDDCDPKRRLNDTIKGLNHHQDSKLIRFRGDGTGEGIIWEEQ